jgi:two-component system sensor histidine kinase BarA
MASEREAVFNAGMDDCLTKPIDEIELARVLQRWTGDNPVHSAAQMPQATVDLVKQPVDWDQALRLSANNASLAKEMLMGLVESLKSTQAKINQCFEKKDLAQMREEVHRLHGACCYCGVPDLKSSVASLESAIVKKDTDLVSFLLIEMNKEMNRLQKYINANPFLFERSAQLEIV